MQVNDDGSVTFTEEEVASMSRILDLGRRLAESLGANEHGASPESTESELLRVIDDLDNRGVSSNELALGLDRKRGSA